MLTSTKRGQRKFFMIASEADYQIGLLGLQIDQKFNRRPDYRGRDRYNRRGKQTWRAFPGVR